MISLGWAVLVVGLGQPAEACGPVLPPSLLMDGDRVLFGGPRGDFRLELRRLDVEAPPGLRFGGASVAQVEAEAIASDPALSPAQRAELSAWRAGVEGFKAADPRFRSPWDPELPRPPLPAAPSGLPRPWATLARGVLAWHRGEGAEAQAAFAELAEGPGGHLQRVGLYHLGRLTEGPAQRRAFEELRALVAAGLADPDGLAVDSLGREAWAILESDPERAVTLYLQQHAAGDPRAWSSLRQVAQAWLRDPVVLPRIATSPRAAAVLTLALATELDATEVAEPWLEAVEAAGTVEVIGADRLAWVAWQAGQADRAARWLDRAPESPLSSWVKARLAMRDGDLAEAERLLEATQFPAGELWSCRWWSRGSGWYEDQELVRPQAEVSSELGLLRLQQGDFVGALDAFARGGHELDLLHVADRVVTSQELTQWLSAGPEGVPEEVVARLRGVAGKRLAREGRWREAAAWFGEEERAHALAIAEARERKTVADAWEAATLLRAHGMELVGTELGPDWATFGGSLSFGVARSESGLTGKTPAEQERLAASAPASAQRFHYRYLAAEWAWEAAAALPQGSEDGSRILCAAGFWLAHRDPEAADRFYKAAVWKSFGSPTARALDDNRWLLYPCAVEDLPKVPLKPASAAARGCASAALRGGWWLWLGGFGLAWFLGRRR